MVKSVTGAQLLVETLLAHGADRIFGVPGESFLAVLDALYDVPDRLQFVTCRHEGGASFMAEADGKLTGQPGLCMVTRGPGASNAAIGLHTAFQDSTPMLLFIGQVARDQLEREAFQEVDYRRLFGQMAKWVVQIDDAKRIPELLGRAWHTATSGRPGPVVIALPEDMLRDRVSATAPAVAAPARSAPRHEEMERLRQLLNTAQRPLMLIGGGGWCAETSTLIEAFARRHHIPVTCAFRRQDACNNDLDGYAGDVGIAINPKLGERIRQTDLLLVVGPRLGEMTTSGYTLLDAPVPSQTLVHVHPSPEELNRVYRAEVAIAAAPREFAAMLDQIELDPEHEWQRWCDSARSDYLAWQQPPVIPGELQMGEIVAWLRDTLPADAIVTNGAGNYATWAHRFLRWRQYGTQLAPTSGAMGYGVPAAVAAKLRYPQRAVICFAGDGCFQMTGQELATAVQCGVNPIFLVINNGMLGTIRMHQERNYPSRISGTELTNPDFAALAQAYGAHGVQIWRASNFPSAFLAALHASRPTLIELMIDPNAITPDQTLAQLDTKKPTN